MSTASDWQSQFDTAFPDGAKVLWEDQIFHVPRVFVLAASDEQLELYLWPMDWNDQQPLDVFVKPPSEVRDDLKLEAEELGELTFRSAFPEALVETRDEWRRAFEREESADG